jgi:hypothetical protein
MADYISKKMETLRRNEGRRRLGSNEERRYDGRFQIIRLR